MVLDILKKVADAAKQASDNAMNISNIQKPQSSDGLVTNFFKTKTAVEKEQSNPENKYSKENITKTITEGFNKSLEDNKADIIKNSGATMAVSDERLKELFNGNEDIVKCFSRINSYEFKYKPEALMLYDSSKGVDENENVGVMAQELEENPVTENTVVEDENGYKNIDIKKLTTADTAVLADVCKRLIAIEEKLGIVHGE